MTHTSLFCAAAGKFCEPLVPKPCRPFVRPASRTHLPSWCADANEWSVGRGALPQPYWRRLTCQGCELPTLTGESVGVWLSARSDDGAPARHASVATSMARARRIDMDGFLPGFDGKPRVMARGGTSAGGSRRNIAHARHA